MSLSVTDPKGNAIQVLDFTNTQALPVGATSTTATDVASEIVRVVADMAICYTFRGAAATTDKMLPANVIEYPRSPSGAKVFSFISATGVGAGVLGTVWVSEAV